MGAVYTVCCCRDRRHNREEKDAILHRQTTRAPRPPAQEPAESSDSDPADDEGLFGPEPSRRNPWESRGSRLSATGSRRSQISRSTGAESDGELQAFISMRDQTDKATEEWEKLNYDIHTLRYARREVRARWKKILLQLGYQCEVEALLSVNKQNLLGMDWDHLNRASQLIQRLLDQTSLFPSGTGTSDRYLYVMDRLVSLDSAEDFITMAKQKYPKTESSES